MSYFLTLNPMVNSNLNVIFIERHNSIRDRGIHSQLQVDLVEHLWQLQGQL